MRNMDTEILQALKRSIEKYGSILAFSKVVGVSHSTVLFWLNGKVQHISTDIWMNKLFPVIENELCGTYPERNQAEVRNRYFHSAEKRFIMQIPVITETELMDYEMPLENIKTFVKRKSKKKTLFEAGKNEEYYSVVLQSAMQKYGIPWKTIVFFSENVCMQNNMLALIKFQDEQSMHICKFREHLGGCSLFEFSPENSPVLWEKKGNIRKLAWTFPIAGIHFCCRAEDNVKENDHLRS